MATFVFGLWKSGCSDCGGEPVSEDERSINSCSGCGTTWTAVGPDESERHRLIESDVYEIRRLAKQWSIPSLA